MRSDRAELLCVVSQGGSVSSHAVPCQHSKMAGAEVTRLPEAWAWKLHNVTSATFSQSEQVTGQPSLKEWGSRLHLLRRLCFTGTLTGHQQRE